MSNHAAVTISGGEIGRAQAMQALAAGVEATVEMNPVLIKPGPDMTSHVVLAGREIGTAHGFEPFADNRRELVLDSYRTLREAHDLVIAEGAGGAAEINLLDRDLVNLPFAQAAGARALLVVDIDRGGAFAAAFGTIMILPDDLRSTVQGIVINSFRGDKRFLGSGLRDLEELTGVPVLGVLPHLGHEPLVGVEDSLDIALGSGAETSGRLPRLRVVAIALPRLSNPSDFDPLVLEPDVAFSWTRRPADVLDADLVVIPGSRATVHDLRWLEASGMGAALRETTAGVLGVCGGYQMLGTHIVDGVESQTGTSEGLGLLDITTEFHDSKIVQRDSGRCAVLADSKVDGYHIRSGRPSPNPGSADGALFDLEEGPEGSVDATARIFGTSMHGLFDSDGFRRRFLAHIAERSSTSFEAGPASYADLVEAQHERLADWVEADLDLDMIASIASTASPPQDLPGWHPRTK